MRRQQREDSRQKTAARRQRREDSRQKETHNCRQAVAANYAKWQTMDSVTLEQHLSQSKSCQLPLPPPCSILPHRSLSAARAEHASNAIASIKLEHCKKFKLHERIVKPVTSATKKPKATKAKSHQNRRENTHTQLGNQNVQ